MSACVLESFFLRNLSQFNAPHLNLVAPPANLPSTAFAGQLTAQAVSFTCADRRSYHLAQQQNLPACFTFPANQLSFNPAKSTALPSQILFWPKSKEEGYYWLKTLQDQGFNQIYFLGENNAGVQAAAKNLAKLGAEVTKLDAAKRCSLFYVELQATDLTDNLGQVINWQLDDFTERPLNLVSLPGVFSHGRLDEGSKLLLSCLQKEFSQTAFQAANKIATALDLGCGYGVLGAALASYLPDAELTLSDVNAFALAASAKTLAANNLTAELIGADVFTGLEAAKPEQGWDLIITNPPFHAGKATSYTASEALISQAKHFLSSKGQLWLVANNFLPYEGLLEKAFGSYQTLAKTNKFKVFIAKNG